MIKLASRPECPDKLKAAKIAQAIESLKSKSTNGNRLTSDDFVGKNYWGEVKGELHQYQNGKCCFCERMRDSKRESDVEHFRPKLRVTEASQHSGYWWLAYEWKNLLFSCKTCNSEYKKNFFPLLNEENRAYTPQANITLEAPMLIDPSKEDPANYIDYDWRKEPGKVFMVGKDTQGKGKTTIRVLGLGKREDLNVARTEILLTLKLLEKVLCHTTNKAQPAYQEALKILRQKLKSTQEYLGFINCYVSRTGLKDIQL